MQFVSIIYTFRYRRQIFIRRQHHPAVGNGILGSIGQCKTMPVFERDFAFCAVECKREYGLVGLDGPWIGRIWFHRLRFGFGFGLGQRYDRLWRRDRLGRRFYLIERYGVIRRRCVGVFDNRRGRFGRIGNRLGGFGLVLGPRLSHIFRKLGIYAVAILFELTLLVRPVLVELGLHVLLVLFE